MESTLWGALKTVVSGIYHTLVPGQRVFFSTANVADWHVWQPFPSLKGSLPDRGMVACAALLCLSWAESALVLKLLSMPRGAHSGELQLEICVIVEQTTPSTEGLVDLPQLLP